MAMKPSTRIVEFMVPGLGAIWQHSENYLNLTYTAISYVPSLSYAINLMHCHYVYYILNN